jgi:peptidyl-tRNA hydrolase
LAVAAITVGSVVLVEILIRASGLRQFDICGGITTALVVGPAASSILLKKQKGKSKPADNDQQDPASTISGTNNR